MDAVATVPEADGAVAVAAGVAAAVVVAVSFLPLMIAVSLPALRPVGVVAVLVVVFGAVGVTGAGVATFFVVAGVVLTAVTGLVAGSVGVTGAVVVVAVLEVPALLAVCEESVCVLVCVPAA